MSFLATLVAAFTVLYRRKLRSALTVLGVLVGVAAVVVVVALGEGASGSIGGKIESLGSNVIYVFDQGRAKSGARRSFGTAFGLTEEDAEAIGRDASSVSGVTVFMNGQAQVSSAFDNARASIMGTDLSYFPVRGFTIDEGRLWTPAEERAKARVVVLGPATVDKLFGVADPIGQTIRIGKHAYVVVGTVKPKGQSPFGGNQDDRVMMPVGSFRARILPTPGRRVQMIMASAKSFERAADATREVEAILRQRHRILEHDEPDFVVTSQEQFRTVQERIVRALTVLLLSVAAVSLFAGGVGVMNVMLVAVTERRREIGIRMAVGARPRDVQLQFLVEAIALTGLGGGAGLALASALVYGMRRGLGWETSVTPGAVIVAVATSIVIGLTFGFLPARQAALVEPMEALRNE